MQASIFEEKLAFSSETACFFCGIASISSKTCDFCKKPFCRAHISKTRCEFQQEILVFREICAKCEEIELSKLLLREFSCEKSALEQEIAQLSQKLQETDAEIRIKTDTFAGIKAAKDQFLERLAVKSLDLGQKIEELSHKNREIERDFKEKAQQSRAIFKENQLFEQILKESSEERSPTGYEHVWSAGFAQKRQSFADFSAKKLGFCEKMQRIFRCLC